jgi:hypothetical protein
MNYYKMAAMETPIQVAIGGRLELMINTPRRVNTL